MNVTRAGIVVTCEHASNRLPAGFELPESACEAHVAWDPGAVVIARWLARRYKTVLHAGRYSRLVVDLNRSLHNRNLIRRVSDGRKIEFNYGLDAQARQRRVERYWAPYRTKVADAVRSAVERQGSCLHLTVHTFTPCLNGKRRGNDVGILYDPSREPEASVARRMRAVIAERSGLAVWLNRPYRGTADGILPAIRHEHRADRYVAIEMEYNQRFACDALRLRDLARWTAEALDEAVVRHVPLQ